MKFKKIWAIVLMIFLFLMFNSYIFGTLYLKHIYPNVGVEKVSGRYINNTYHYLTIPVSAISELDGEERIYLAKDKKNYWVEGTFSVLCKVQVVAQDSEIAAITAIDAEINDRDYVIIKSDKRLDDGQRVFANKP